MYKLRQVTENDRQLLFDWANDPDVRANAKNPKSITWDEHNIWFDNKLSDSGSYIYILEDLSENIGVVRFEKKEQFFLISYSIDKKYRGQGFGKLILTEGIKKLSAQFNNLDLIGYVKNGNVASEKIFNGLGFILIREEIINNRKFSIYQKKYE